VRNPAESAAILRRAAARVVPGLEDAVQATLVRSMFLAREKVGRGAPGWPPLAPATYARGTVGPLERSGALRESFYVEQRGLSGKLASDNPYIVYSELGTSHEPPRPILRESVREALREEGLGRMRFLVTLLFQ
jgi:hypothetical protein